MTAMQEPTLWKSHSHMVIHFHLMNSLRDGVCIELSVRFEPERTGTPFRFFF